MLKEITVECRNGLAAYEKDVSEVAYDCTLIVGQGCKAMYFINGRCDGVSGPGRYCINEYRRRRENNVYRLVAVNMRDAFLIKTGGSTRFAGRDRIPYKIGIWAEVRVCVDDPVQLCDSFGFNVTEEEISQRFRKSFADGLLAGLCELANRYPVAQLKAKLNERADEIKKTMGAELSKAGLKLASPDGCCFGEPYITEEYIASLKEAEQDRREEEKSESERSFLRALNQNVCKNTGGDRRRGVPEPLAARVPTEKRCPFCHAEKIPGTEKFCPVCGRELL